MKASEALKILHDGRLTESAALAMAVDALREKAEREEKAPTKVTLEEQEKVCLLTHELCVDQNVFASGDCKTAHELIAAANTLRTLRNEGPKFLAYHTDPRSAPPSHCTCEQCHFLRKLGVEPK